MQAGLNSSRAHITQLYAIGERFGQYVLQNMFVKQRDFSIYLQLHFLVQ